MKTIFVLASLLIVAGSLLGNPYEKPSSVQFNVSIKKADTLRLYYTLQNEGYNAEFPEKEIVLKPGQNSFLIDFVKEPTKVGFSLASDTRFRHYSTYILPNQQIDCQFTVNGLVVTNGVAAQIFSVSKALDSIKNYIASQAVGQKVKHEQSFGLYIFRHGIILDEQLQYLNSMKAKIPYDIYESMRADLVGEYLLKTSDFLKRGANWSHETDSAFMKGAVVNLAYQVLERAHIELQSVRRYTSRLILGCYHLSTLNSRILKNGMVTDFQGITADFQGELRAKVLLFSFNFSPQRSSPVVYANAVENARQFMKSDADKKFLKMLEATSVKGAPFFPFSLFDTEGKMRSLKDFEGRVIVIDFWFTGCTACAGLASILHEKVIPVFKGKEVVFISVNLDAKKTQWITSVQSGKYTTSESINLYTGGMAFNHPLAKYYSITGGPYFMLVDREGKLITTEIPRRTAEEIIQSINAAL